MTSVLCFSTFSVQHCCLVDIITDRHHLELSVSRIALVFSKIAAAAAGACKMTSLLVWPLRTLNPSAPAGKLFLSLFFFLVYIYATVCENVDFCDVFDQARTLPFYVSNRHSLPLFLSGAYKQTHTDSCIRIRMHICICIIVRINVVYGLVYFSKCVLDLVQNRIRRTQKTAARFGPKNRRAHEAIARSH